MKRQLHITPARPQITDENRDLIPIRWVAVGTILAVIGGLVFAAVLCFAAV